MAPVGPLGLDEVRTVLSERLGRLEARPSTRRYGAVFVAPPNTRAEWNSTSSSFPASPSGCFRRSSPRIRFSPTRFAAGSAPI